MRVAVILNRGAGSAAATECDQKAAQIRAAFAAVSVEADVHLCAGEDLVATARRAAGSGVDAVVAAGGDGTVSAVASALLGGDVALAVLPLGTLNHFAKDLGMPLDLEGAAAAIAAGRLGRLDAGEVNGRSFVNNSSIGLYPEIVTSRDEQRRTVGRSKWWAMAIAAARVLRRFPLLRVRVATPEREVVSTTPFVFIGNNDYETGALSLGKRQRLDGGHLALYMVRCRGRFHMFWLMVRAVMQRLEAVRDFDYQNVDQLVVQLHGHRRLRVSLDGEVVDLQSPLHYRIRAGALPVFLPPAAEATDAASRESSAA
jgi:diacylglycerol kinase family enzyme